MISRPVIEAHPRHHHSPGQHHPSQTAPPPWTVPPSQSTSGRYASYWNAFLCELYHILKVRTIKYMPFAKVLTNYGEAYSANSGFFIAPVNGLYLFSAYMQVYL